MSLPCAPSGKDPSASAWSASRSPCKTPAAPRRFKFRLLRRSDLSPVNYKRVAEVDGKEVPWGEIVKGYEYEKDKFVVLKDEDFKRVDLEATDTIDIVDFVELAQINPIYFHRPYYLEPQKGGQPGRTISCVGAGGLQQGGNFEGDHPHPAASRGGQGQREPARAGADALRRRIGAVRTRSRRVLEKAPGTNAKLDTAKTLVKQMTEDWDPERYTDDYRSALMTLIESKK